MKNTMKKVSVLLMALVMVLSLAVPAFAAAEDGVYEVNYKGHKDGFVFTVDDSAYTESDLFENFKDVMPGAKLPQTIDIINSSTDSDYIKLYLQAVPHNEENKPVAKGLGNVNIAEMEKFLNQMDMTVTNSIDGKVVFEGSAGELDGLKNAVYLGKLDHGDASLLTVTLTVPSDMGNEFSDRIGEIDWKFIAEQFNYSTSDDDDDDDDNDETYKVTVKKVWEDSDSDSRPKSIKVKLTRKGKTYDTVTLSKKNNWRYTWRDLEYKSGWNVKEVAVPDGYNATCSPKGRVFTITNTVVPEPTGQLNWPIPVLAAAGLILIGTGASLLRKGKGHA